MSHEEYMREAIKEAEIAEQIGEVPVGAVVVRNGEVIARGHNEKMLRKCATAHAEILAIENASKALSQWYLEDCELYVTMEPCAMCAGAIINSRIEKVYFGTYDLRFGACGTLYNLPIDPRFNHRAEVTGGILQEECLELLQRFFRALRQKSAKHDENV